MNDKIRELTERLNTGLDELMASDRYAEYLRMQAQFYHYSWHNTMLILLQRPNATRVAGIKVWNKLGRRINRGEHGIMILAPNTKKVIKEETDEEEIILTGFRTAYVFDAEQTNGEPLTEIVNELKQGVDDYNEIKTAIEMVAPCPITFEDITDGAKGRYFTEEKRIEIKQGMSEAQTVKTMLHETAHAMLHANTDKDRETKECEAESVAYIVSTYLGVDTSDYSFGYIATWADKEILKNSLKDIQKCADRIITGINKKVVDK